MGMTIDDFSRYLAALGVNPPTGYAGVYGAPGTQGGPASVPAPAPSASVSLHELLYGQPQDFLQTVAPLPSQVPPSTQPIPMPSSMPGPEGNSAKKPPQPVLSSAAQQTIAGLKDKLPSVQPAPAVGAQVIGPSAGRDVLSLLLPGLVANSQRVGASPDYGLPTLASLIGGRSIV